MERKQASLRTRDALKRKVENSHVASGTTFGYKNIDVFGDQIDPYSSPLRLHVERHIKPEESPTVIRIFELPAQGFGYKRIAKRSTKKERPRLARDGLDVHAPGRRPPCGSCS